MDKAQIRYKGRFGNQLFQYAFARSYANLHNCELESSGSPYLGILFNITETPLSCALPVAEECYFSFGDTNIMLDGIFTTRLHTRHVKREDVKKWFTFDKRYNIDGVYPPFKYNAVHLRRTDFSPLGTISKECVDFWIKHYGCDSLPTIYLSDDAAEASNKKDFDINEIKFDIDFVQDFLIMCNATNLFRSNSTFSWWAAELARKGQNAYSPVVWNKLQPGVGNQFVEYEKGNKAWMPPSWRVASLAPPEEPTPYEHYFGAQQS